MERLPVSCPACRHPIDPSDAYCAECGTPIVASLRTWTGAAPPPDTPAPAAPPPPTVPQDAFVPLRIGTNGRRRSTSRRPFWRTTPSSR